MRSLLAWTSCAVLALSVGCVSKTEFNAFREETAKSEQEMRTQITDLQGKLKAAETALKDTQSDLAATKTDLGGVKTDQGKMKGDIDGIKTLVAKAQGLFIRSMSNMRDMYKRQFEAIDEMLEKEGSSAPAPAPAPAPKPAPGK